MRALIVYKFNYLIFLFLGLTLLYGCTQQQSSELKKEIVNLSPTTIERNTAQSSEGDERISWQKPETVIKMLGDLSGQTVADIGSGTGYFAFRLALRAEKVIALEIDPNMIKLMDAFKVNLPTDVQNKFEARVCTPTDPLLSEDEVDKVLIINTITFIEDREGYLQTIKKGLKSGGQLMIVDFKMKQLDIDAPEIEDRMPLYQIEDLLQETGYEIVLSDDSTLNYQYIVIAKLP